MYYNIIHWRQRMSKAISIRIPDDLASKLSEISEEELQRYSSGFLSKVIRDNPGFKLKIEEFLNGVVKGNNSGIKLIDKFGLFVYDSRKNGVRVSKTRFFYSKNIFLLFVVFKDKQEGEYTLFLEYKYNRRKKVCNLKDVYFSLVFNEKREDIENFFKYR